MMHMQTLKSGVLLFSRNCFQEEHFSWSSQMSRLVMRSFKVGIDSALCKICLVLFFCFFRSIYFFFTKLTQVGKHRRHQRFVMSQIATNVFRFCHWLITWNSIISLKLNFEPDFGFVSQNYSSEEMIALTIAIRLSKRCILFSYFWQSSFLAMFMDSES